MKDKWIEILVIGFISSTLGIGCLSRDQKGLPCIGGLSRNQSSWFERIIGESNDNKGVILECATVLSLLNTNRSNNTTNTDANESISGPWARTITTGTSALFLSIATDSSGNIYAVGRQSSVASYTYGTGVSASGVNAGNNAIIVKYDPNGTALWARSTTSGTGVSIYNSVAVDSEGNVYAVGLQNGNGAFGYGDGITATGSSTSRNSIIVKYSPTGTTLWAKTVTVGTADSIFNAVTVNSSGTVFAAGFQESTGNYNYGSGNIAGIANGVGRYNATLVRYGSGGDNLGAVTVTAGADVSLFNGIAADSNGNVYAVGRQSGTGNYNYGNGNITGIGTGANWTLVKYNSSGVAQWAKTGGQANGTEFHDVKVDSNGNIYAVGYSNMNVNTNYGDGITVTGSHTTSENATLVKFNASGTTQWARSTTSGNQKSEFRGIVIDSTGNIYAGGYKYGTVALSFSSSISVTGTCADPCGSGVGNDPNVILIKYDSSGTVVSGNSVTTGNGQSQFYALARGRSDNIVSAGFQAGNTKFTYLSNGADATGVATDGNDFNPVVVHYGKL